MKKKEKKVCKCSPECECGCNEGKECTCEEENCKCCEGKECSCDECNCDDCECEECSCEDLVEEILPTLDNFERAIKLDDTNLTDELSKFLEGFKLIYCHLTNALEKYGVKAIDGNNKPFDPTYHNAVMVEKVEGVKPGMVVEVLQKGYLLKDKVIRTAMVKVSE